MILKVYKCARKKTPVTHLTITISYAAIYLANVSRLAVGVDNAFRVNQMNMSYAKLVLVVIKTHVFCDFYVDGPNYGFPI